MPRYSFTEHFEKLTGYAPFPWQQRLHDKYLGKAEIPRFLDIPTGLGKTSVMAIWLLARLHGVELPLRLVYIVDRRAVVDQATEEAEQLECTLRKKFSEFGLERNPDIAISTLRGQHVDNQQWLYDPAKPAIIVGTVDMIGSRLLFNGYGVSRRMRSVHAGMLGTDTLFVIDEAHLVPPFEALCNAVARGVDNSGQGLELPERRRRLQLLSLSATRRAGASEQPDQVLRLSQQDREDPVASKRLTSVKRLHFDEKAQSEKELIDTLFNRAWQLGEDSPGPILIYADLRKVAKHVHKLLQKNLGKEKDHAQLFVGSRRVYERTKAKDWLENNGFIKSGQANPDSPRFLVATSAGEVGVDMDAAHAVMDLVPWERMVQRLGRINRRGEGKAEVFVYHGEPPKDAQARQRLKNVGKLLRMLPARDDGSNSASPDELGRLANENGELVENASSKTRYHPRLTKPLAEGWSLTGIRGNTSSPEVGPWLRGWDEDDSESATTTIIWRRHMPFTEENEGKLVARKPTVNSYFKHARIHLAERLEIDSGSPALRSWVKKRIFQYQPTKPKDGEQGDGQAANEPPAGLLIVERDGELADLFGTRKPFHIYGQDDGFNEKGLRDFLRDLQNRVLVLDARLGGLSGSGMLDDSSSEVPRTIDADSQDDGMDVNDKGFEVKVVVKDSAAASEQPASEDSSIVIATDSDNEPSKWLAIVRQANTDAPETDASGEISSRSSDFVTLADHTSHVKEKVGEYCDKLEMPEAMQNVFAQAAKLHDQGKAAPIWQNAMGAKEDGRPYAKTKSANGRMLDGYRHEFGSILAAKEDSKWLSGLNEDGCELALHLVATHHGNAMPDIRSAGSKLPPSMAEATALEIQLRRYRLQRQFGVWGLAWLEAVFRAADRAASIEEGQRA